MANGQQKYKSPKRSHKTNTLWALQQIDGVYGYESGKVVTGINGMWDFVTVTERVVRISCVAGFDGAGRKQNWEG